MASNETAEHRRQTMMSRVLRWTNAAFLAALSQTGLAADSGLITMPSNYSVEVTVQRFEAAIRAKSDQGWMVFTELDHAAAAEKNGLKLPARTVIVTLRVSGILCKKEP